MAKFIYFEVEMEEIGERRNRGSEFIGGDCTLTDRVFLGFGIPVLTENAGGRKTEEYTVLVSELPRLFGDGGVSFPPIADNGSFKMRLDTITAFLGKYIGKTRNVESAPENNGARRLFRLNFYEEQ